jgi:large subunit ribosomal protein L10
MPNTKKIAIVEELSNKLSQNSNVALIGFDKTSHTALEALRKSLRKIGARITVIKSSLLEKAVEQTEALVDFKSKALPLKNTTAMVQIAGDTAEILKAIFEYSKKETSVFFKSGFLDKVAYDRPGLEKLALLPSRTVLLGKVIGSLKSPVNRVDYAIKFPMTYFVNTLKARVAKG